MGGAHTPELARLTPQYSANRAVRQYTEDHYLPRAAAYKERAAQNGRLGLDIVAWQSEIDSYWADLGLHAPSIETRNGQLDFSVRVCTGRLHPESIQVELFAEGRGADGPTRQIMKRSAAIPRCARVLGQRERRSVPRGFHRARYPETYRGIGASRSQGHSMAALAHISRSSQALRGKCMSTKNRKHMSAECPRSYVFTALPSSDYLHRLRAHELGERRHPRHSKSRWCRSRRETSLWTANGLGPLMGSSTPT